MSERFDEEWECHVCADCDPEFADADDTEDPAHQYEKAYVILVPQGEAVPETCPRCGSYLGFTDRAKGLRITNTPAERWAANRQKEQHERSS